MFGRRTRRRSSGVACAAPFTSAYLDQHGNVRACCVNDGYPLGNVKDAPFTELWQGSAAVSLRDAMRRHDLSLGCDFCEWQVAAGRPDLAFSRWFERFDDSRLDPQVAPPWPRQLELALSNTCNLQCVMCNGDWSSSIRSQRLGLDPLPQVYDDAFFDDLATVLPHLERIKFLGGEPFLASETMRVMEMLTELAPTVECHVTTNGTQLTPRVERILEMGHVEIAVSLDGATRETYEAIRVGSSWDAVRSNIDYFAGRGATRGSLLTLTYCLMTVNWHEFGDFCRLADSLGVGCAVNTVTHPAEFSLYHLPSDELAAIVGSLRAADSEIASTLGRSLATWRGELTKLGAHLDDRLAGRLVRGIDERGYHAAPVAVRPRRMSPDAMARLVVDHVGTNTTRLLLDRTMCVASIEPAGAFLGHAPSDVIGRHVDELADVLADPTRGRYLRTESIREEPGMDLLRIDFDGGEPILVAITQGDDGHIVHLRHG